MSFVSAVRVENKEYNESYMCKECNTTKYNKPWVNYDSDNKCICSYLCYNSHKDNEKNLWERVNNKGDFETLDSYNKKTPSTI